MTPTQKKKAAEALRLAIGRWIEAELYADANLPSLIEMRKANKAASAAFDELKALALKLRSDGMFPEESAW